MGKRKSQIMSQVFVYILAALIFILILAYGYKAIAGFSQRSEQVAFATFKAELESNVKSMRADYGSVKFVELALPSKYTRICFIDLSFPPDADSVGLLSDGKISQRMYDAWQGKTQNVFLVPMEESPIVLDKIYVTGTGYICNDISGGKIRLRIEGYTNNRAYITFADER